MADFDFKEGGRSYKGSGNRGLAALAIVYGTRLVIFAGLITCGYVMPGAVQLLHKVIGF